VPLNEDELGRLDALSKWIVDDARYPVTPRGEANHAEQWNRLIQEFWDDTRFTGLLSLYEKVHSWVSALDASEQDPKVLQKWDIDDDGYIVYRIGGMLHPRIIVRYSSRQRKRGDNSKESLRALMLNNVDSTLKCLLTRDWDSAVYKEIH
jgi:hypothetical protein